MARHLEAGEASAAPLQACARWWGGRVFEAQVREERIAFDPGGREGVAAMEGVLASLASSLGSAVAALLEARGTPFDGLEVRALGRAGGDRTPTLASVDVEVCLTRVDRATAEDVVALAASDRCPVSTMLRAAGVDVRVSTVLA